MHADSDVLGLEGRKAVDACVKVKIIGTPVDTRTYHWDDAVGRLQRCLSISGGSRDGPRPDTCLLNLGELLLPPEYDDKGSRNTEKTYNILEIREALKNAEGKPFVEKDPRPGTRCDDLKKLIDKRRKDIEEEFKEASTHPDARVQYSWLVAQRRVRDCYAGNFPYDGSVLFSLVCNYKPNELYNIFDIYNAFRMNKESVNSVDLRKNPSGPGSVKLKESIKKNIFAVKEEYQETKRMIKNCYTREEAQKRITDCLLSVSYVCRRASLENVSPSIKDENGEVFYIFDIYKILLNSGVQEIDISKSIRDEYKSSLKQFGKYSRSEAEHRVRDCFPGTSVTDTNIFPTQEKSYDIFDIKDAINNFDQKKLFDQQGKEEREKIEQEYSESIKQIEIEHGSGFIINDHYVITNKHVINDAEDSDIFISNASIGELSCKTAYTDPRKDLALLYCQELNLKRYEVTPLHLSNEPLLPGMKVFSFGYPMSHTGKTALFVNGHVSGSKETYLDYTPSLVVLNLSLNSGNSGGPILCWIANQLKVVGVATQKHFKEILTLEQREKIEEIRESLQTSSISDDATWHKTLSQFPLRTVNPDRYQIPIFLLTLKLYDALETHSQFNLSNAIPGHCVIQFIDEFANKPERGCKDELIQVVKWSADPDTNILPSGHLSAAECCVQ